MANVLVTGAAGFIAHWLVRELLESGHGVLGIDDLSGGKHNAESVAEQCRFFDLRDADKAGQVIASFKPDYLFHLAANAREGASFYQPRSIVTRNLQAYINVLVPAIKHGLKRVILFSSISVYGKQPVPFSETILRKPVDPYGLMKSTMEQMTEMLAACHDFEYIILRPHNVFGPGQCLSDIHRNVFAIWMNRIMRDEPLQIYGDGQQKRAFSYIEDSLPSYMRAMTCKPDKIYNIGSDIPIPIIDAAHMVTLVMGKDPDKYPIEHLPGRHKEVEVAYSSIAKAQVQLGLKRPSKDSFKTGLEKMATWAKEQGPQDWATTDKLEITNEKTPENWL